MAITLFLKDLTEVKIEPLYQKKDLNIDAKVKFMEHGNEVSIDKKGDGTKRRITMALLEYKKEQALLEHDASTIYLLDEPDTHLHVKAQIEFLETVKGFSDNGSQVILTTHSPFIINSVKPKKLRLLENNNNHSRIKYIKSDPESADVILRALGIENTYLFFSKHIIIVEGETEEKFIPSYFIKAFDESLSSSLVKGKRQRIHLFPAPSINEILSPVLHSAGDQYGVINTTNTRRADSLARRNPRLATIRFIASRLL